MDANNVELELARLRAENAALKADRKLTFRVSPKGGLSVYGLGRFPVTLYKEQWTRLLEAAAELKAFLKAYDHLLKGKGE
jgi:hypothetical protein